MLTRSRRGPLGPRRDRRYVVRSVAAVLGALVLAGCGGAQHAARTLPTSTVQPSPASTASALRAPASGSPSGSPSAGSTNPITLACGVTQRPPTYAHVIWIWMENRSYGSVRGAADAPYENGLARQCGSAANYHGVTHPSLPNYLAATGGSTFGVSDDDSPAAHPIDAPSIFGQLDAAGLSWRGYEESMPGRCVRSGQAQYAVKHNPAAYYTRLRGACMRFDVPLGTLTNGALAHDLDTGSLPSFSFVTPNLCDDMHSCSVATGDRWLRDWISRIVTSASYRAGGTVVFLTWDEGESGNHIPTFVIAPSVPRGIVAPQRFDHYALLATAEDLLGLPRLGAAKAVPAMRAAFNL